ncbi:MAG: TolC family protein [Pirellulales bacterium]|nr:TolC family protein [Pirellulales bacterium]
MALILSAIVSGCTPSRPHYLREPGELRTYVDSQIQIEYPDVQTESLDEVTKTKSPITLSKPDFDKPWDLTLQEAVQTALRNSKVIRNLGSVTPFGFADGLSGRTAGATTVYDPAIFETDPRSGVLAALAEFDAQFTTSMFWQKSDRPQNVSTSEFGFVPFNYQQDQGQIDMSLSKKAATGTQFSLRNQTIYDQNNRGFGRALPSDWYTAIEGEVNHPLLRGNGTMVNRIPLLLARINTDVSVAMFESAVRNMVLDIENTYWDLYTAYRNLEAAKIARDSAHLTWKIAYEKMVGGIETAQAEAQAQEQYFFFQAQVETAWNDLLKAEQSMRWLMGLSPTDGRVIRPSDEPAQAKVVFDWQQSHEEALIRSVELRQQKWSIKRRELELKLARHNTLPQVNLVAMYRWLGYGDQLIGSRNGLDFVAPDSNAVEGLTSGNYQEFRVGIDIRPPKFGARAEFAALRNAELNLKRDVARLEDMELNTSHLLTTAMKGLDYTHRQAQLHYNRWAISKKEVDSAVALYRGGKTTLDQVLQSQRRHAQAQTDYYRALGSYSKAIADVHYRKGSLLNYNDIHLSEGQWPDKAYDDAMERARQRDAGRYMDYGFTRPGVISSGVASEEDVNLDPQPQIADPDVQEKPLEQPQPAEVQSEPELEVGESDVDVVLNLPDYSLDL